MTQEEAAETPDQEEAITPSDPDLERGPELPGEQFEDEGVGEPDDDNVTHLTTSDDALVLSEMESLAERNGLDLVLIAGEVNSGKTTLVVALWNTVLASGGIGNIKFAGSANAIGLDRRAWLSRIASSAEKADTIRTRTEESGFVHLRLLADGELRELMLSDYSGEIFTGIREGEPIDNAIEWIDRARAAIVLVNGEEFVDPETQSSALAHARRQLIRLRESERRNADLRVAVVLSKADALNKSDRKLWASDAEQLAVLARLVDPEAAVLEVAARPADATMPVGLDTLAEWLLDESATATTDETGVVAAPDRMIGQA